MRITTCVQVMPTRYMIFRGAKYVSSILYSCIVLKILTRAANDEVKVFSKFCFEIVPGTRGWQSNTLPHDHMAFLKIH